MGNEKQSNIDVVQKRLISVFKDETKISALSGLLDMIENNSFATAVSNIENFYTNYGDFATKKEEIDEILDDVKDSQEKINNAYSEIYDIDDRSIALKDSSSILNNLRQANNDAVKIRKTYINFYGQKDSEGNQTQGIDSKHESACSEIEESEYKINELKDFYDEVFNGITDDNDPKNNKKSWVDFLDEKKEYVNNMIEQGENDFKNLKNKINSLLPGATSAGLARAYMRQRRITEKKVEKWNRIFNWAIVTFAVAFLFYFILAIYLNTFGFVDFFKSLPLWVFSGFFIYY